MQLVGEPGYHSRMSKQTLLAGVLALTLLHPPVSYADLPDLGEVSDASLTLADENRIGRQAWRAMLEAGDIVDDQEVNDYLNDIGGRLSSGVKLPGVGFTYFCVNDSGINAFAMPGGYIGINIGLLLATQSEGELASVLGHETAHVAQRHIARIAAASSATSPFAVAGTIIAAALAAKARQRPGRDGGGVRRHGLVDFQSIGVSRDFEREADRVGMQYMSQAGFDVRSMPAFFQRLQQNERYSDNAALAFLRTHPVTLERISEAENRALDYPVKMRADSSDYLLVREKLRHGDDAGGGPALLRSRARSRSVSERGRGGMAGLGQAAPARYRRRAPGLGQGAEQAAGSSHAARPGGGDRARAQGLACRPRRGARRPRPFSAEPVAAVAGHRYRHRQRRQSGALSLIKSRLSQRAG